MRNSNQQVMPHRYVNYCLLCSPASKSSRELSTGLLGCWHLIPAAELATVCLNQSWCWEPRQRRREACPYPHERCLMFAALGAAPCSSSPKSLIPAALGERSTVPALGSGDEKKFKLSLELWGSGAELSQ